MVGLSCIHQLSTLRIQVEFQWIAWNSGLTVLQYGVKLIFCKNLQQNEMQYFQIQKGFYRIVKYYSR